jgi:hypothetical protein
MTLIIDEILVDFFGMLDANVRSKFQRLDRTEKMEIGLSVFEQRPMPIRHRI